MDTTFEYKVIGVNEIGLEIIDFSTKSTDVQRDDKPQILNGGKLIRAVIIDGEPLIPTGRFWESLYAKFGLNKAFFKFFDHLEIFNRIHDKTGEKIRVCIEKNKIGEKRLLAVTGLNKPVILYDNLMEVLQGFNLKEGVKYSNGVVTSTHSPLRGSNDFKIGGDKYSNKFTMYTPIDGYGQPNVYLSLLRWVCSNGAIGFANSFKTALALGHGGDSIQYTLKRALEAFSNEEGYAMMRERFESSMRSWASIREQQELYRLMLRLQSDTTLRNNAENITSFHKEDLEVSFSNALVKSYDRVSGNPFELYRISDPNLLGQKKQRTLPVSCKVYDLINFATELATHYVNEDNARTLQAWVGNMISGDFDLEDSCDQFDDFRDVFLANVNSKKKQ